MKAFLAISILCGSVIAAPVPVEREPLHKRLLKPLHHWLCHRHPHSHWCPAPPSPSPSPSPSPPPSPSPSPSLCSLGGGGAGCDEVPGFIFENNCDFAVTVRGLTKAGDANCGNKDHPDSCVDIVAGGQLKGDFPALVSGQSVFFSTKKYARDLTPASLGNCFGQTFCGALEIASDSRSQLNFDNQYSWGISVGLTWLDAAGGAVSTCPEANLVETAAGSTTVFGTSVAGQADNCLFDIENCPKSAWRIKTSEDDPVTWCVSNDGSLAVFSHLMDNTADCPKEPAAWAPQTGENICRPNNNLATAVKQMGTSLYLVSNPDDGPGIQELTEEMVENDRPGGVWRAPRSWSTCISARYISIFLLMTAGAFL